jgi:hypothetical protein
LLGFAELGGRVNEIAERIECHARASPRPLARSGAIPALYRRRKVGRTT